MNRRIVSSMTAAVMLWLTACTPAMYQQSHLDIRRTSDTVYNILAAEFSLHAGDEEAAAEFYAKAIEDISDINILKNAALLAYKQKDYVTAARIAERWIKLDPDNVALYQRLAVIYLSIHEVDKAIAIIESLTADNSNTLFAEISRYGLLAADDKTLATANKLAKHFPDRYAAQYLYARLLTQAEQYTLAADVADRLIELNSKRADGYKIKAYILKQQNQIPESVVVLRQGLDAQAADVQLQKNYAQALIDDQQYQQAYEVVLKLYEMEQDDPEVLQMLGVTAMSIGKTSVALQYFDALSAFPGLQLRSQFFQAHVHYKQEEYAKAITLLDTIPAEASVLFEESQLLLVRIYRQQGNHAAALEQLQKARQVNEDKDIDINFYIAEGELLMREESYSDVYVLYTNALEEYADVTEFRYLRAIAASELGHMDLMEADIQFILARDPDNVDALNAFGYCLADKNVRLKEAKGYILQALKLSPDNAAVIDSLGWVEFRLNNLQDAETLIRDAQGKISDPVVDGHLVEVLRARGQSLEAEKKLHEAIEKFPDNKYLQRLQGGF